MLTIGALARRVRVRPSAIRYYEAQGLLRPSGRLPNGYRVYAEEAVAALRFISRAKGLGFTLAEIKRVLALAHQGEQPCECVQELIERHLRNIDSKIGELVALRRELQALLHYEPDPHGAGTICPIIEATDCA